MVINKPFLPERGVEGSCSEFSWSSGIDVFLLRWIAARFCVFCVVIGEAVIDAVTVDIVVDSDICGVICTSFETLAILHPRKR